ncbi:green-sensitive opsin-3-like [Austrofundulus limnaeus]|uniref:Green-sensitive opsin-3-like n=1 Tax=Austrofundulus limnaeus TaxID=52670 RepID=A0A2I4CW12_AUSLI|nr:PREDICTED: green-sensitive opsin-3-like [Austrofundulus limnaeus]
MKVNEQSEECHWRNGIFAAEMCSSYSLVIFLSPSPLLICPSSLSFRRSLLNPSPPPALPRRWLYGETACSIYAFCGMLFGLCSLTTLTLLSMVCFMKVCYPLYGNQFKSLHGQLLIACAWVYALLFACSPLVHWGKYGPEPYGTACCIDWRQSNRHTSTRSYAAALFVFCYILPCCLIVASHTGILVTVQTSRKTMAQHASKQTQKNNIQRIIVKLSVGVCIGFFAAWSPYAVISMWAAFGQVENIPPLAFAVPAVFAKSSTIYNPIINVTLRPNIRRMMCRDLGVLFERCLKRCLALKGQAKCCSKPEIKVRLRTIHRQSSQFPSSISAAQPPVVTIKDYSCQRWEDGLEHFGLYPQMCATANPAVNRDSSKDEDAPLSQAHAHVSEREMAIINTLETNTFNFHLKMAQRSKKQAWS